jgi:predicted nucleotidyltransferase
MSARLPSLPEPVGRILSGFVESSRASLGTDLLSIVLFGSAAEGKLRKTSDVNVIVVLTAFDPAKVDMLREPLRAAHAAIKLEVMFLLEGEIASAVEAFAVKFADVLKRRHLLYGPDPFVGVMPSRAAEIARLKQVLLNLVLRLRQGYLLRSLRDEQAALLIAGSAGPLRACAEALVALEGKPAPSPKEALVRVVSGLPDAARWGDLLRRISEVREAGELPKAVAPPALLRLIELVSAMHRLVEALH